MKLLFPLALAASALLLLAAALPETKPQPAPAAAKPAAPPAAAVRLTAAGLPGVFVPAGRVAPTEPQGAALAAILDRTRHTSRPGPEPTREQVLKQVEDLERYLKENPASPFNPSIHENLAQHYGDRGLSADALDNWRAALAGTAGDDNPAGREIHRTALAHYAWRLLIAGRDDLLGRLLEANQDAVFDGDQLTARWELTLEAYRHQLRYPQDHHKCGIYALDQLGQALGVSYDRHALASLPGDPAGTSLAKLQEFAGQFGMNLTGVQAKVATFIPAPAIAHFADEHYALVTDVSDEQVRLVDPATAGVRWMHRDDYLAEASGYYLVPAAKLDGRLRGLDRATMLRIVGRAILAPYGDEDDEDCDDDDGDDEDSGDETADNSCPKPPVCGGEPDDSGGSDGGDCGCQSQAQECCEGMPGSWVSQPYANLWLKDKPLTYRPSYGPRVAPTLRYRTRGITGAVFAGHNTLGGAWRHRWFGAVAPVASSSGEFVEVALSGRSTRTYRFPLIGSIRATASDPHLRDGSVLRKETAGHYRLNFASGRELVFGQGTDTGYALTEWKNRQGLKLTFHYLNSGGTWKMDWVQDALGKTTTLTYHATYPDKVYRITTPDARYVQFGYNTIGTVGVLLTSITDAAGIQTVLTYDTSGRLISMGTPYGTTSWDPATPAMFDRMLRVTRPDGTQTALAYVKAATLGADGQPLVPASFLAAQLPQATPDPNTGVPGSGSSMGTMSSLYRNQRNSFYWGPHQMAAILPTKPDPATWTAAEVKRSRINHWLLTTRHVTPHSDYALGHVQAPSPDGTLEGQLTWYDYPGKMDIEYVGTSIFPAVKALRLPGSSETRWVYYQRNALGKVTERRSTYTDPATGSVAVRTDHKRTYDPANLVDLLDERDGSDNYRRTYTYNAVHRILTKRVFHTATTNPNDSTKYLQTTYSYDANQRMATRLTPGGLTTTWVYTVSGAPADGYTVVATDAPVSRTETEVWLSGNRTSHTDWRGLTRTFEYDGLNHLTKTTYPDTTYTQTSYTRTVGGLPQTILDPAGRRDRLGNWTYYGYNGLRQLTVVTNARNFITWFGYCSCGALGTVTDPLGNVTTYAYDNAGHRTGVTWKKPDGTVVGSLTTTYDLLDRPATVNDGLVTRTYDYNHQGLRTAEKIGTQHVSRIVYDLDDRPQAATDRNGVTITLAYDNLGRVRTRTYPDAGVEAFAYGARGLASSTNQLNKVTSYLYDEAGRKTSETNPNTEVVGYTYNAGGDLLTLTDGRAKVTSWTYDTHGRVTAKRYAGQTFDQITYTYDANSRLATRKYWSSATTGQQTAYTYDATGNLTLVDYPASPDLSYAYDGNNRVSTMTDASGSTAYTYKAWGALDTEDGPWTGTTDKLTYAYDAARRRSGATLEQPGGGTFAATYGYDTSGRLNSVVSPAGTFGYTYATVTLGGYTYVPGEVGQVSLPGGPYVGQTFDSVGRLLTTALKTAGGTVLNSHAYLNNAGNQRYKQTLTDGSYVDYAYDNFGQLDTALTKTSGGTAVGGQQFDYGYDAGWNLATRATGTGTTTYTANDRNQATTDSSSLYSRSYDANGNYTGGSNGTVGAFTYLYDDENQLVSIATDAVYTPTGSRWKTDFTYDGRGRLRKRVDSTWNTGTSAWQVSGESRYVYDGMLLLQERSSGNLPLVSYTRGLDLSGSLAGAGGIGGLLGRSVHSATTPYPLSTSAFYHADGNGNVTALVDGAGTLQATYKYDPYGRTLSSSGTLASANLLRFSSKPWVQHNLAFTDRGLYYYGYRFYDPNTGKWVNRDPIGELGGLNLYSYVYNNPIRYIDRDGLDVWLEGPSGKEPSLHQSVCVGNPNGKYDSYSFGMNGEGFLGAEVYTDDTLGGPIDKYKKTTPEEDKALKDKLDKELGKKGTYGWDDICRSYSQRKFREAPGKECPASPRNPIPQAPGTPSPSSCRTITRGCSTTGIGTSR